MAKAGKCWVFFHVQICAGLHAGKASVWYFSFNGRNKETKKLKKAFSPPFWFGGKHGARWGKTHTYFAFPTKKSFFSFSLGVFWGRGVWVGRGYICENHKMDFFCVRDANEVFFCWKAVKIDCVGVLKRAFFYPNLVLGETVACSHENQPWAKKRRRKSGHGGDTQRKRRKIFFLSDSGPPVISISQVSSSLYPERRKGNSEMTHLSQRRFLSPTSVRIYLIRLSSIV